MVISRANSKMTQGQSQGKKPELNRGKTKRNIGQKGPQNALKTMQTQRASISPREVEEKI